MFSNTAAFICVTFFLGTAYCLRPFFVDKGLFEGSRCNRSDGVAGTCTKAFKCPRERFIVSIRDTCSFTQSVPVICCEHNYGSPVIDDDDSIFKQMCRYFYVEQPNLPESEVNNTPSIPIKNPYMGTIGRRSEDGTILSMCNGVLIHPFYVLTAAQCVADGGNEPDVVQFAINAWEIPNYDKIEYEIKGITIHPAYNPETLYNDIAVLRLVENKSSVNFYGQFPVKPICLWIEKELPEDKIVLPSNDIAVDAFESDGDALTLLSNDRCELHHQDSEKIPKGVRPAQFCAYHPTGKVNTCEGNPGRPLLFQNGNWTYVAGITSFGYSCTRPKPGVFIRLYSYLDWIEEVVFYT